MLLDYSKLTKLERITVCTILILLAVFLFFEAIHQFFYVLDYYRNGGTAGISQTAVFSGEGKVTVKPDTAKAMIGLVTEGKDTVTVQNENSSKMNAVIKFLKNQRINESDIKTSSYSLSPKYEYNNGKSSLAGYILNQNLEVTIRNIDKVGAILDGAVSSGANQINSISLFVDKPEELKNQAREEAINQAKEKALAASKAAGFGLGRIIGFSENVAGEPPVFFETVGKGGGIAAPSTNVEPGSQEITVDVNLTYLVK